MTIAINPVIGITAATRVRSAGGMVHVENGGKWAWCPAEWSSAVEAELQMQREFQAQASILATVIDWNLSGWRGL